MLLRSKTEAVKHYLYSGNRYKRRNRLQQVPSYHVICRVMSMNVIRRWGRINMCYICTTIGEYCDPHYPTGFCGQSLGVMHKKQLLSVHLAHTITWIYPNAAYTHFGGGESGIWSCCIVHTACRLWSKAPSSKEQTARGKHNGLILLYDSHRTKKKYKKLNLPFASTVPQGGGDYNKYKTVTACDGHFHI